MSAEPFALSPSFREVKIIVAISSRWTGSICRYTNSRVSQLIDTVYLKVHPPPLPGASILSGVSDSLQGTLPDMVCVSDLKSASESDRFIRSISSSHGSLCIQRHRCSTSCNNSQITFDPFWRAGSDQCSLLSARVFCKKPFLMEIHVSQHFAAASRTSFLLSHFFFDFAKFLYTFF